MGERSQRAIGTIRHSGPEHIVDRVGADARWQAGHSAVSEIPGHPEPVAHVGGSRAAKTLAVRAARIKPNVLIAAEYLGLGVLLSPDWYYSNGQASYSTHQLFP